MILQEVDPPIEEVDTPNAPPHAPREVPEATLQEEDLQEVKPSEVTLEQIQKREPLVCYSVPQVKLSQLTKDWLHSKTSLHKPGW